MNPTWNDPSGSCSSDAELARKLSKSLRGLPAPAAPAGSAPPYTQLGGRGAPASASAPQAPPRLEGNWGAILQGCAAYAGASLAFLTDGNGLAVASFGPLDALETEGMGSRLAIAFDQAGHLSGGRSKHVALDLGRETLTGLRLRGPGEEPLTLGLLTAAPLSPPVLLGLVESLKTLAATLEA